MRLVLLCGMAEPERETGAAARNKRYREKHPDRVRENQKRFLANNPTYMRDYMRRWYRARKAA